MTTAPLVARPVRWTGTTTRQVHDLYTRAFPAAERVPLPLLHANALRPSCQFLAWFDPADDSHIAGLTYSLVRPDIAYLGFLAVDDSRRSRGYGSRILNAFGAAHAHRTQVLEIEPVEESAANYHQRVRRLAFYRRNGFEPTDLETHEGRERYTVLTRNGDVTRDQLQRAMNRFGLWIFRSRVISLD